MNPHLVRLSCVLLALSASSRATTAASYTNFIRQVQVPSGVQWDASVAATGTQVSALAIDTSGARFELWTVLSSPLTSYLLDTRYVSAYAPVADVAIHSEDPYQVIPRTRADRPFSVNITISGLLSGATDPTAAKSVKLLRYVQSYGVGGTGETLDRTQATLLSQASLTQNGTQTLSYSLTSVPATNLTKARGEERFTVDSLADGSAPEAQIVSKTIQIWPVADGSISGITQDQQLRFKAPQLTFTLNDLYPDSRTYAQVYQGEARLGVNGTIVQGTSLVVSQAVPKSQVLVLSDYDSVFTVDGRWTMELLTVTPFGIDRLAYVSFNINRTITANATFTTAE